MPYAELEDMQPCDMTVEMFEKNSVRQLTVNSMTLSARSRIRTEGLEFITTIAHRHFYHNSCFTECSAVDWVPHT